MQQALSGIDYILASARFISKEELDCDGKSIKAKSFIIATGSRPYELGQFQFDGKKIVSSNEALDLQEIPNKLLIIGGGVIGCEFASLFRELGSDVTIAEKMPQLLPGLDSETAKKIEVIFKKKKIAVNTASEASAFKQSDFDRILVCVGRAANTEGLNVEGIGVNLNKGRIITDDFLRTNIPNIFAAGDCTGRLMLAHFAAYQGEVAAQNAANPGSMIKADNAVIPSCIFSDPEIACVGLSEEEAKTKGIEIKISKFDFLGSGMARIIGEPEGFIKSICDAANGRVLGASIIGPKATELISVFGLAVSNKLNAEQVKNTVFAHPSLSESIQEVF
jgi:dihydrolipoamide dehydrogenase